MTAGLQEIRYWPTPAGLEALQPPTERERVAQELQGVRHCSLRYTHARHEWTPRGETVAWQCQGTL